MAVSKMISSTEGKKNAKGPPNIKNLESIYDGTNEPPGRLITGGRALLILYLYVFFLIIIVIFESLNIYIYNWLAIIYSYSSSRAHTQYIYPVTAIIFQKRHFYLHLNQCVSNALDPFWKTTFTTIAAAAYNISTYVPFQPPECTIYNLMIFQMPFSCEISRSPEREKAIGRGKSSIYTSQRYVHTPPSPLTFII